MFQRFHWLIMSGFVLCMALTSIHCAPSLSIPQGITKTEDGKGPLVVFDLDAKPLPEIPLPNDLATRIDPTSVTGRRVNVSMLAPTFLESGVRKEVNQLTGFGVYMPITVRFKSPLDVGDIVKRHQQNDDFQDDVLYVVCLNKRSPMYGKPVLMDMGRGNFPVTLERTANYFDHDPHKESRNLFFETRAEVDVNKNGKLDPDEDLDHDGVWDTPNTVDKKEATIDNVMTYYERETNTLIMQPVIPLEPESTYAVILTKRLKGEAGNPIRSPFPYINHTRQTQALLPLFEEGLLKPFGLEENDVAFAWTFTTGKTTRDMKDIRDGLYGHGPFQALRTMYPATLNKIHTLAEDTEKPWMVSGEKIRATLQGVAQIVLGGSVTRQKALLKTFDYVDYIVAGDFVTPYFLTARDKDGNPVDAKTLTPAQRANITHDNQTIFRLNRNTGKMIVGKDTVPWWCVVPKATERFKPPFPVVFYGHGYTSSRFEMIGFAGSLARFGLASCGLDAVGHGASLSPSETKALEAILGKAGLLGVFRSLSPGRARDLNNDGYPDSGGDFWTADMFHTRDVVRQSVIDHMQMIRIMRTWDGKKKWSMDGSGDGKPDLTGIAGDFNGDGVVDFGGPSEQYHAWGISLGGFLSSILAATEPAIAAAAPVSGGAGLLKVGARSSQGGVVDAVFMRTLGPFVMGYGKADGTTELRFGVADVADEACSLTPEVAKNNPTRNCLFIDNSQRVTGVRFYTSDKIKVGDKIVLRNLRNKEERWAIVRKDGSVHSFRVAVASDALDALEKGAILGVPSVHTKILEDSYQPPELRPLDGKSDVIQAVPVGGSQKEIALPGDAWEIVVYKGTTDEARETIKTFGHDVFFQGILYKKGLPLFALSKGFGLKRQTPELRRFIGFGGMIVSPGDPVAYAKHFHLQPMTYTYERRLNPGANVLVIPTIGDAVVPVDTGIGIARAAGIIPVLRADKRYPHPEKAGAFLTPNQVLIRHYVLEGIESLNRFLGPDNKTGVLFDPDNLSGGRDGLGVPRLEPPLRLTVPTHSGVAGMRLPYIKTNGAHGFSNPDPERPFDVHQYMINVLGVYFRSNGKELRDHPCLERSTCSDIQKAAE